MNCGKVIFLKKSHRNGFMKAILTGTEMVKETEQSGKKPLLLSTHFS